MDKTSNSKRISDLKPGDRVKTDIGVFTVRRIELRNIFEPPPYEVFVDGGESVGIYEGEMVVALEDQANGE